jgi:hypothetical protein
MARVYSDENMPLAVVEELRRLGHDVLTSHEAGNANRSVSDEDVLSFASGVRRILITLNRKHFIRLHEMKLQAHAGIFVCFFDADFVRQANRIHEVLLGISETDGRLIRLAKG